MVSFILNNFISHLIHQDSGNVPDILNICQQTIDRYKYKLNDDDKIANDIKHPLSTIINVDWINNKTCFLIVLVLLVFIIPINHLLWIF